MCRNCDRKTKNEPPSHIRKLATAYATKHGVTVVICQCNDWDFQELGKFDFENQIAVEIITQKT